MEVLMSAHRLKPELSSGKVTIEKIGENGDSSEWVEFSVMNGKKSARIQMDLRPTELNDYTTAMHPTGEIHVQPGAKKSDAARYVVPVVTIDEKEKKWRMTYAILHDRSSGKNDGQFSWTYRAGPDDHNFSYLASWASSLDVFKLNNVQDYTSRFNSTMTSFVPIDAMQLLMDLHYQTVNFTSSKRASAFSSRCKAVIQKKECTFDGIELLLILREDKIGVVTSEGDLQEHPVAELKNLVRNDSSSTVNKVGENRLKWLLALQSDLNLRPATETTFSMKGQVQLNQMHGELRSFFLNACSFDESVGDRNADQRGIFSCAKAEYEACVRNLSCKEVVKVQSRKGRPARRVSSLVDEQAIRVRGRHENDTSSQGDDEDDEEDGEDDESDDDEDDDESDEEDQGEEDEDESEDDDEDDSSSQRTSDVDEEDEAAAAARAQGQAEKRVDARNMEISLQRKEEVIADAKRRARAEVESRSKRRRTASLEPVSNDQLLATLNEQSAKIKNVEDVLEKLSEHLKTFSSEFKGHMENFMSITKG